MSKRGTMTKTGFKKTKHTVGIVEEDSKPSSDPDVYYDRLPKPFNFINKCLEDLIIKRAFEQIVKIENKKKEPEYEGFLKTIYSTGFIDINGITSVNSLHNKQLQTTKFILGDKQGTVHLLDTSRKNVLDK